MDASGVFLAKKSLKTLHSCQKKAFTKNFFHQILVQQNSAGS